MQAGMAYASALRGTPPGAAIVDPRTSVRAIPASLADRPLSPWHADPPTGSFLHDHCLSPGGSGILIKRAAAGTGQPHR
jgi:hypothetical protein